LGDFLKVNYLLKNMRATIESYSETISQIFEFKTSEVIRRFSILAFLGVPLLLYATILLQPKIDEVMVKTPADYWLQMGAVFVLVVILAFIFRKKGWL
jgi:Mg2+ and Co2+ transporter CorA